MFVKGNMKWQSEYSVSGLGWISSFSLVNTFAPFAWLCVTLWPTARRAGWGSPSEQELASPPVPKPLWLYNTWNLRTWHRRSVENSMQEQFCHGSGHLKWMFSSHIAWSCWSIPLLLPGLDFPHAHKHILSHMSSLDQSLHHKFTMLHFWMCLTYVCLLAMCAFDRDIRLRDSTKKWRSQRIKDGGCGRHERTSRVGRYEKNISESDIEREREHVCLFNDGVGSR